MGSPLAPVLANLFMGHHERIWLENYKASSILFYRRYVDDTFCLFDTEHDTILFFDYINDRYPNIRFTMEKEMDKKIPFLDVLIDNSQPQSLITRVYRKKTVTGLLTNYFSFTPFSYKLGLIRTLVDRTYKINNTWLGFHEDIKKLVLILRKILFPSHIVEKVIRQYITKTQTLSNISASPPSNSTHFLFPIFTITYSANITYTNNTSYKTNITYNTYVTTDITYNAIIFLHYDSKHSKYYRYSANTTDNTYHTLDYTLITYFI